jgi:hypothetical protein
MKEQAAFSALLEDAKRYAEQNPKPERTKPLTAAERKTIILEIIQAFHKLGMIQDDAENRKGDAAPTKEQCTANS